MQKCESIGGTLERLIANNTPLYEIEQLCMQLLTEDLKPSRFQFVKQIMEENFEKTFEQFETSGRLVNTVIEVLPACEEFFLRFEFNEAKEEAREERILRYAIAGVIDECLNK
jgi:hypothetical protein